MTPQPKITPFLWFDDNAEAAVRFYTSLFADGKVLEESRWGDGGPVPKGTLMTARFQLGGQQYVALNGGPTFRLTEAFSLAVSCDTQREIDELWQKLIADGGEESMCGWLKDKFGLSWQIVPRQIVEWMGSKDPATAQRVSAALLQMHKLDIETLKRAYEGR